MPFADLLPLAFFVLSALVLFWNIHRAGQISQLRRAPRPFRALTALAGLLIAPAILVLIASLSMLRARAVFAIAWLWPATLLLFAAQAIYALVRRLVFPLIGVPIAVFNIILTAAAIVRYAVYAGASPPPALLALDAAEANGIGYLLGRAALFSPFAIQLPLLAPAYPSRWRWSATVRGAMVLFASVAVALFIVELPHAYMAVTSYDRYASERLQERPRSDFTIGLRVLPDLHGSPSSQATRLDFALLDSVDVGAISVVIDPEGVQNAALDSLARTVEDLRRDSVLVIATLGYRRGSVAAFRRSPTRFFQSRVADVERIARRVRPDYLLPARDPYDVGTRELGRVSLPWWEDYLRLAARAAHRVDPRIRVGVSISSFTRQDSLLYAWAAAPTSPLDVVGFSIYPSYGGGAALAARLRTADRWMRTSRKEHWIFAGGGYPLVHGELSQERAVWALLTWGTSHPRLRGVVIESAADYQSLTGLRAPSGRTRPALGAFARAVAALSEATGQ